MRMSQHSGEMLADGHACRLLDYGQQMLSEINFDASWREFHGGVKVGGMGDVMAVLRDIDRLREIDVRVYFPGDDVQSYSHLKMLASLGVGCGLWLDEEVQLSDEYFVDLASYHFMSPVPHAGIEPFAYISSRLDEEKNIRPLDLYSAMDTRDAADADFESRLRTYYHHFMELDACAKCKAFRICCGCLKNNFSDCEQVMGETLEYVVLGERLKNNE